LGRCPGCREWNSFVEMAAAPAAPSVKRPSTGDAPRELSRIAIDAEERFSVPLGEFNRVLGGGMVPGSLMLISGEPGIGKSTLMLQAAALIAGVRGKVVYVTGEETLRQTKLRSRRLGIPGDGLFLLAETDLDVILRQAEQLQPGLVVIDSIQTTYLPEEDAAPGSITQVRQCTLRLMQWAKSSGVPVLITGHVTKEGAIAGPRVLEHIVDVVLYLEGERFSAYRLLRCVKNRFGSTNEIGVFEMKGNGLVEVENPSLAFLSQRGGESIGSVVVPVLELLVEVQALTNTTSFGMPRRTANGVDFNRVLLVTAVLSKRLGLKLGNQDIMVNVTGGLKIGEPAADLSGELRTVPQLERRIGEVARLGFKRCLVPKAGSKNIPAPGGIQVVPVSSLREAVSVGIVKEKRLSKE